MFYDRLMLFPYGKRSFCCCFSYSLESFKCDSLNAESSWGDLRSGHGGLKIYYIIVQSLLFLMRSEHNSKVGESICLVLCFQTFQREKKAIQIKTTVFNTFG